MPPTDTRAGSERTYDVVVFGATGFTGRLAAEYLARYAPASTRWAVAGRNRAQLEGVAAALSEETCPPRGVLVADVGDDSSVARMAAATRVVLTTVGPYVRYGEPVVRACVEQGADYVDITGEPIFVDRMIEKYDDAARASGVRIVNCCGFDSAPHDLGALFTAKQLPSDAPMQIEGFVRAMGRPSGGTWNTMLEIMGRHGESRKLRAALRARRPPSARKVGPTPARVKWVDELKSWAAPLPTIDPDVVRRSARVLEAFGPDFRYGHYVQVKSLPALVGAGVVVGGVAALAQLRPTRALLGLALQPGTGPSAERRARSWFTVTFLGQAGGRRVITEVAGGDPGYGETAKMLAESALCLALDRERLPHRAGVLTTAVAMGEPLIERFIRAGITFRVKETA